jgi:hypothetical protein
MRPRATRVKARSPVSSGFKCGGSVGRRTTSSSGADEASDADGAPPAQRAQPVASHATARTGAIEARRVCPRRMAATIARSRGRLRFGCDAAVAVIRTVIGACYGECEWRGGSTEASNIRECWHSSGNARIQTAPWDGLSLCPAPTTMSRPGSRGSRSGPVDVQQVAGTSLVLPAALAWECARRVRAQTGWCVRAHNSVQGR